jgi:hypothetical protein
VAIGLLVYEQVIIEESTRNVTPVNCFSQRTVQGLPSDPFPVVVFDILTDGLGDVELEVAIQRLDNLEEIYRRMIRFHFPNPLNEVRCLFRIRDCSFPAAGAYQITLLANNELVALRKVRIETRENPT